MRDAAWMSHRGLLSMINMQDYLFYPNVKKSDCCKSLTVRTL